MKWPMVKLGSVIKFIRGITFKPEELVEPHSEGSIVVMRTKNVQVSGLDTSDLIAVPSSLVKRDEQVLVDGDLLMSSANSWEQVGKSSYVSQLGFSSSAGGFISIIRPLQNKIDSRYLYHWVMADRNQHAIRHCGRQTTNISNLDVDRFKDLEIPLPPMEEQKRIAAILDKADAIRRKRQQAIDLADDFLRSVFLDMFGDPVTNPKGWDVELLGEHIQHANNGLSRRRKIEENIGDIVLRLQDVHYESIRFGKELNRIELEDKEKSRYRLDIGDLLFIRVNGNPEYVGRSAVFEGFNEEVFHNDHLIRIKVKDSFNSRFLSYMLNLPGGKKIISSKTKTSAGQHTISQGGIESLEFIVPPIDLQNKFVNIQSTVNKQLNKQSVSFIELTHSFSSLSQKAFAGEL